MHLSWVRTLGRQDPKPLSTQASTLEQRRPEIVSPILVRETSDGPRSGDEGVNHREPLNWKDSESKEKTFTF